jgi:hypothetical protein
MTGSEIGLLVGVLLIGALVAWNNRGRPLPGEGGGQSGLSRFLSSLLADDLSLAVSGGGLVLALLGSVTANPWLAGVGLTAAFGGPMAVALRNELRRLWEGIRIQLTVPQTVGAGVTRLLGMLPLTRGLGQALGGLARRATAPLAALGKLMGSGRRGLLVWGRRARQLTGAGMVAAAIGLGVSGVLLGDSDDTAMRAATEAVPRGGGAVAARAGAAAELDPGWLEGLARAWFTYEGEERWLAGLEPYLVLGGTHVLRACLREQSRLGWRLARTSIVEGPWVEVQGPLSQLEYGLAGRGGAVGQPDIRRQYGVELRPDDVGVRLSAVVARELPPEKARLPGTDIITRPQRVDVQFFIVGGKAVPDVWECGRGVAFVG